jgi:hypothetical protein
MGKGKTDERVTKRRVTMRSAILLADGKTGIQEAVDYVLPEQLDAYVNDARTRWQVVEVSEQPDAGPGGYNGQTVLLDGTVREATKE